MRTQRGHFLLCINSYVNIVCEFVLGIGEACLPLLFLIVVFLSRDEGGEM